ncbi:MAG: T9SS type A sorting domain-containing protein [Flavobacteriales bacterium]|nr:T9SS type A sorting domain-containing protein [Flavobacteriales bacterium]
MTAVFLISTASAQFDLQHDQSIPVLSSGAQLDLAWAGGANFCQFSNTDLDLDGRKDLFVFDRSGNEVIALINDGGENYHYDQAISEHPVFRKLRHWALLADYNCDGKEDLFTYSTGGFAVYKNISAGMVLDFELVDTLVRSNYVPTDANLYVTQIDLPGIGDIDQDGDLDVVTFSIFGAFVEYHKNLSMELYGTCDSLVFEVRNRCWGYFSENLNNNSVELNDPCNFNVPSPEFPQEIARLTAADRLRQGSEGPFPEERAAAHVGSTNLLIDLDGDAVQELILGDVSFNTLNALFNGGTVDNALMTGQDSLFPSYDTPVQLPIFPGAFYEDVDDDGKRDLLVSPNGTSLCQNYESIWYYRNTGTDEVPNFEFQRPDQFQTDMIDVGEGASPHFFDHNGDGLMDLIISNHGYYQSGGDYPCKLALFQNIGTATDPVFELVEEDYMDLSTSGIGNSMHPTWGDVDGDGDLDMYIGDLQGKLHYYENVSTGPVASFQLTTVNVPTQNGTAIDVGQFATPQLFDMDGDQLLDLVIGERNGNINYYRNNGSVNQPEWVLENDSLGMVVVTEWLGYQYNVSGYSKPFVFMNGNGERELLVGSESGWIYHYQDIDGNLNGIFTQTDSTFQGIKEGYRSGIALNDLDGDGLLDAVTGNYRGGLGFWRNVNVSVQEQEFNQFELIITPNPADDGFFLLLEGNTVPGEYVIMDATGRSLRTGPMTSARTWVERSGLAAGTYLVLARSRNGAVHVSKLVLR